MAVSSRYLLLWDDLAQPHLPSTLFSFVLIPHNNLNIIKRDYLPTMCHQILKLGPEVEKPIKFK